MRTITRLYECMYKGGVRVSFEAKERAVDKLLNDAIYFIPRNQRRYVWNSQHWSDMYDDVLLVADKVASSHFIGSIVLKDEGKDEGLSKYTVIDGQQRILTLTIFLIAIMFTMKKRNMMDDFGGTQKYLVAKDIKNKYREIVYPEYHLSLPKMVNYVLEAEQAELAKSSITAFANKCTVSSSKDKNIADAFKFFASKLEGSDCEKILQVRDAIIGISYVNIISSTVEDSYTIFEILNARGLDLEDHELLKNYIMRYLHPIEMRDDAKRIWEEIEANLGNSIKAFLRHYAIQRYNYNNDKKRGVSVYKAIQTVTKGRGVNALLDDLHLKSSYYARMLTPDTADPIEHKVFSFFKSNRVEQFRPLILSLMRHHADEILDDAKYHETLQFLYIFFVCYKIIGEENSNKLSDTVYKYAYVLETEFSIEKVYECIGALKSKLPTFDAFRNAFRNIGYSRKWGMYKDTKNKERCLLVLQLLEEHVSNRSLNLDATIEHVLPDCEDVSHSQIGNLFLLERKLNERCGDLPIDKKMPIYDESSLACPKGFVRRYQGKAFSPESRTDFLAKTMYSDILGIKVD